MKTFYSKSGKEWFSEPSNLSVRRQRANILRTDPDGSLTTSSLAIESVIDSWKLFFPDNVLLDIILHNTNIHRQERIRSLNSKVKLALDDHPPAYCLCEMENKCRCYCHRKLAIYQPVTISQLKAFIGIVYMKGCCKGRGENLFSLWNNNSTQRPFYSGVMSRNDFVRIFWDLRFDDKNTRPDRLNDDNLAAIRELWDSFNGRLLTHFTPSVNLTIDEQLILFRGRCKFKIYNKSKPGRYGFLVRWLCDAGNRYALHGMPYCSTPNNAFIAESVKLSNKPYNTVIQCAQLPGIIHSGRNITTDRLYTSVDLAETLITVK